MATELAPSRGIPAALHRAEKDLPFVVYQEGVVFQLLQVDVEAGLWVIRARFQPGVTIQRHKHTGEVFAFTLKGSWRYFEYPEVNTAGSYLKDVLNFWNSDGYQSAKKLRADAIKMDFIIAIEGGR